tara:strand:+ start:11652 stop:12638 length:987 start_codon:yes stop_codon:yes gene_type:complete
MIISKTPYRISFFGGGTDMPTWYLKNTGQVLSTTIDKYSYITFKTLPKIFGENIRLVYSKTELVDNVKQIKHPSIREVLKFTKLYKDINIHYNGDLPAFSGLGSSSAFTVGLLNALYNFKGISKTQFQLGLDSINIEQNKIKENVGSQDQMAVAVGGLNHIKFNKNNKILIKKIKIKKNILKRLEENLLLFYTGMKRNSNDIQNNYLKNIHYKNFELDQISKSVDWALEFLKSGNLDDFGNLLNEMWKFKKKLNNKVSNNKLNEIYDIAMKNGALGGKLIGAGGGGFYLFYANKNNQNKIKQKLGRSNFIDFRFEDSGSTIVYKKIKS